MKAQIDKRGYATIEDVLMDIGLLEKKSYEDWIRRRVPTLEHVCHGNLSKLSAVLDYMREYARENGFKPSITDYKGRKFSRSGAPAIEIRYSTHYVGKKAEPKAIKDK